jgi:hypothetical protein
MSGERDADVEWAEGGRLEPGHVVRALSVAGAMPDVVEWRRFVDRLLRVLSLNVRHGGHAGEANVTGLRDESSRTLGAPARR